MLAQQHFASLLPLRKPHWRLNRVTEMLRHRPQPLRPRRMDDHPIRAYLGMLECWPQAMTKTGLQAVNKKLPRL